MTVGTLLVGGSLLTGNAAIITAAGGVGVNLASEGIASLWGNPRSPLVAAGKQAMRATVNELQKEFQQKRKLPTPNPFQLLIQSANDLAQADCSQPYADTDAVQQALAKHLDQLLHGHDEYAVAFLRQHLLVRFTHKLQYELTKNEAARREFHGWLIQQTNAQMAGLATDVQQRLRDSEALFENLDAATARLEALLTQLAQHIAAQEQQRGATIFFKNTRIEAAALDQQIGNRSEGDPPATLPPSSTPAILEQLLKPGGNVTVFDNTDATIAGKVDQQIGDRYSAAPPPAPTVPPPPPTSVLTIAVDAYGDALYRIRLSTQVAGSTVQQEGQAVVVPRATFAQLPDPRLEPDDYAKQLTAAVFGDEATRTTFAQSLAAAQVVGKPLRVQVALDPAVDELHRIVWELLHNPQTHVPVATSEQIIFARYLGSRDWRTVQPAPPAEQRLLAVVANPTDITSYAPYGTDTRLAAFDTQAELAWLTELASTLPTTPLTASDATTLDGIIQHLRDGATMLYLLAHGSLHDGQPYLWLSHPDGQGVATTATSLIEAASTASHPRNGTGE